MLAGSWRAARESTDVLHLDTAACGRASLAVRAAVAEHARREAVTGGYAAAAEAEPVVDAARAALGALVGLGSDVVFTESAHAAFVALVASWPLPAGARVAVAASEWGRHRPVLRARGWSLVEIPGGSDGLVDVDALARLVDTVDLACLAAVPAHRGVVQPVHDVAAVCAAAGVPLVVDAAQALGHVDCSGFGAAGVAAVVATSRKWLCGPRGVGVLAVAPPYADRLVPRAPAFTPADLPGLPSLRLLESQEGHVAGRVGLGVAVAEQTALGPAAVHARLREVGHACRVALAGVGGWAVVEPYDSPTAITTLRPPPGVEVAAVVARLAGRRIVVSAVPPWRAPGDLRAPVLRLSPHMDLADGDLDRVAAALAGAG